MVSNFWFAKVKKIKLKQGFTEEKKKLFKHFFSDVSLNPKKSYEYRYEGMVNFGLGKQNLAESGVKITCKVKITGASEQTYVLQVSYKKHASTLLLFFLFISKMPLAMFTRKLLNF